MQLTESRKLLVLRDKLVLRRREIVDSFQTASLELLNGDAVAQIQSAIDAVDRAIADEKRAESNSTDSPMVHTSRGDGPTVSGDLPQPRRQARRREAPEPAASSPDQSVSATVEPT
jgi:hypothetical protein